jgi:pyrroloquinoline quinone biosynthesis protein E
MSAADIIPAPVGLLAELTHRCPLQCPYCSNPLALERAASEMTTADWLALMDQAADLGVLQLHLSGGEPTVRRDLEQLVARATARGLYANLITSGYGVTRERLAALSAAGLAHVQVSIQDADAANADRIAGVEGAHARKLSVAEHTIALGMALTVNAPVHRQNIDNLEAIVALAVSVGARRLEVANVQYYGWGLANRAALLPSREQVRRSLEVVQAARDKHAGILTIDYVAPDHYARRPKACMGGWGRGVIVVTPSGKVLPCHAAESIPGLAFETIRDKPLREIWLSSTAFNAYRGTEWMQEPCRSCELKEIDWGGCRCQALALAGDAAATDPVCAKSPLRYRVADMAEAETSARPPAFVYRQP